jgi:hypothetical protein
MRSHALVRDLTAAFLAATALAAPAALGAQEADTGLPETFTAFAVNMSGVGQGAAGKMEFTVERWSTDAERDKLRDTLIERGPDKLLDVLQDIKPRVGYMRTPNSIGYDLYFARQFVKEDGSRRVILATNRNMSFAELRQGGRSTEYEFTLIEMRFPPNGKGQGKWANAVKVSYNKDTRTVELENYTQEPIRLTEITAQPSKPKK